MEQGGGGGGAKENTMNGGEAGRKGNKIRISKENCAQRYKKGVKVTGLKKKKTAVQKLNELFLV